MLLSRISRFVIITALMILGTILLFSPPSEAQINCRTLSHWSATNPAINQTHVFCGEWNSRRDRAVGFHSRPQGKNPSTVTNFITTQAPNQQGIYGGQWNYVGQSKMKFSTMFPNRCTRSQVLNSIVYAAKHPSSCPANAPSWANCGLNKPASSQGNYCQALDGSRFPIAFAKLRNQPNKINTAFPLRQ
jgi:hypothetical protein